MNDWVGGPILFCPTPSPHPRSPELLDDLQNSEDFRQTWKIYRGKPNIVDLRFTDDVTGQGKPKMSADSSRLGLSRTLALLDGKVNKSTCIVSGTYIVIFVGQM